MKSNNGEPCSTYSVKRRCVHTAIVTLHLNINRPEAEDAEDGMEYDGAEYGPEGSSGEENEDGTDCGRNVEPGWASCTQQSNPEQFARNMAQLRMIEAIYHFPVEEPDLPEGTYGRDKISIRGCHCTACGEQYEKLSDADATLVAQVQVLGLFDVDISRATYRGLPIDRLCGVNWGEMLL